MKILAIRLKNLTSIEGSVEVDFTCEPLRSAGIFAISGPTGAGKSTLLDALCLALYDKAPRFAVSVDSNIDLADVGENTISQSDVRNLLRRGMADGYAEVDFLGMTGCRYRSRWSVKRTGNRPGGSLKTQTLEVRNLDTGQELQGRKKELLAQLVELVGLTYDQFTRTALLAQNDFATFLKSKGSAKAELLEKLTGTGIYSRISQEVFARNKAAAEEVNVVRGKMSVIELMPEEEYQSLLQEKETFTGKRAEGIKRLAGLNEQWTVVRSLQTQEELLQKKRLELQTEEEKMKSLQQTLAAQEEVLARFKAQCEAIQPDLKKARQLDAQIQAQQNGYVQAEESCKMAAKQVAEQELKYKTAENALQNARREVNRQMSVPLSDAEFTPERVEALLAQEEQTLAARQKENDELREQLNAFGYPSLMEQQVVCRKEQDRLQAFRQLANDSARVNASIGRASQELQDVTRQLSEKQAALNALFRVYDNARIAIGKNVKTLRSHLQKGEPCPVCGSTSHPYHEEEKVADTLYLRIEEEYNAAYAAFQQVNNRHIALTRDLTHWKQQAEQYAVQRKALCLSTDPADPQDIYFEQQLLCLHHISVELGNKVREYNTLLTKWQQQETSVKQLRACCQTLRNAVSQYRLLQQKLVSGAEQLVLLRKAEETERKRLEIFAGELERLRRERSALLKGKSVEDAEAAVARREKELNAALDQARKEAETLHAGISGLQGEIRQLAAAVEKLSVQKAAVAQPEQLPQAIAAQEEENLNLERALTRTEGRLLQHEKNKEVRRQLERELAEKQTVSERWAKLNKLIGSADGAKFKVIAQSYTLNLLLLHSNQHLSYLSRRYKLQQVPGTLGLQVIDRDMCDEVRTVYSLSGGESFLISLALALGLSSLSSNNLKVESLFIDEGFGSLDAESLRTAMEALEQLQMQGRKVGVISHVPEMSERISVQVQVEKRANGKSRVIVVG